MPQEIGERSCYAKDCTALAEFRCLRCGKSCCAQHARQMRLERRDDRDEATLDPVRLTRVPSQVRTYALCLRCKS